MAWRDPSEEVGLRDRSSAFAERARSLVLLAHDSSANSENMTLGAKRVGAKRVGKTGQPELRDLLQRETNRAVQADALSRRRVFTDAFSRLGCPEVPIWEVDPITRRKRRNVYLGYWADRRRPGSWAGLVLSSRPAPGLGGSTGFTTNAGWYLQAK